MSDFFALYDAMLSGVSSREAVVNILSGSCWTAVETETAFGMAMTTPGATIPAAAEAATLGELARAVKSWNLEEASRGMAAVNAFYNTPARLEALDAYEPFENYCTAGLDLRGKHIGVVGHLNMPEKISREAASLRFLERDPRPGDYPDTACDWLLPQCDVVILTASTLVNKSLPHLLTLCRDAYTILTGPSCPMCPDLLNFGIHRLSGLVITDVPGMKEKILRDIPGTPYPLGRPFLLRKEAL